MAITSAMPRRAATRAQIDRGTVDDRPVTGMEDDVESGAGVCRSEPFSPVTSAAASGHCSSTLAPSAPALIEAVRPWWVTVQVTAVMYGTTKVSETWVPVEVSIVRIEMRSGCSPSNNGGSSSETKPSPSSSNSLGLIAENVATP